MVEGKDDISAVRLAVEAEVIAVHGYGVYREHVLDQIRMAHERCGVIVLTDPDWAGEKIREIIEKKVPGVKHAFIQKEQGTRASDGNIGVENASAFVIRQALKQARCKLSEVRTEFGLFDLLTHGLSRGPHSCERRHRIGEILGIGYANSKQLIRRLNHFGISRDEFEQAILLLEVNRR